jgi:hypothetical protein
MPMSLNGLSTYPDFFAFGITLLLAGKQHFRHNLKIQLMAKRKNTFPLGERVIISIGKFSSYVYFNECAVYFRFLFVSF